MRTLLMVAALLLGWATAMGAQTPQSRQKDGMAGWPPVGPWAVLPLPLPTGGMVCLATTREPPWGPAGFSAAFVFSMSATHFYLSGPDSKAVVPKELVLAVDDRTIAHPMVIDHEIVRADVRSVIVADLPGDMFIRQVAPAMIGGHTLTVTADQHSYSVPTAGFQWVVQEIAECAETVLGIT